MGCFDSIHVIFSALSTHVLRKQSRKLPAVENSVRRILLWEDDDVVVELPALATIVFFS